MSEPVTVFRVETPNGVGPYGGEHAVRMRDWLYGVEDQWVKAHRVWHDDQCYAIDMRECACPRWPAHIWAMPTPVSDDWVVDATAETGCRAPGPVFGFDSPKRARFGFSSMRQLNYWFRGWGNKLAEVGLVVREYEVQRIWYADDKQVVFDRGTAKIVATHDPKTVVY